MMLGLSSFLVHGVVFWFGGHAEGALDLLLGGVRAADVGWVVAVGGGDRPLSEYMSRIGWF